MAASDELLAEEDVSLQTFLILLSEALFTASSRLPWLFL
jgi:hypothetical protein